MNEKRRFNDLRVSYNNFAPRSPLNRRSAPELRDGSATELVGSAVECLLTMRGKSFLIDVHARRMNRFAVAVRSRREQGVYLYLILYP